MRLDIDPASVEAIYPLPAGAAPASTILLQGNPRGGTFAVSGHTLPPAVPQPEPPAPMPLHANLLAHAKVRTFGIEERVRVETSNGKLSLQCSPGNKPAGVLISGPWFLPQAQLALKLDFSGNGRFGLQVADAGRALKEGAVEMGALEAAGAARVELLNVPPGLDRKTWQHFAITCPPQGAHLSLGSLSLEPGAAAKGAARSGWVWKAQDWQQDAASLFDWARREGLRGLFIAVPLDRGAVRDRNALAAFVRQAHQRGMQVHSVEGDPHMVLPGELAATARRARAFVDYNASVEAAARLDGVQFDVEPYLLPGYDAESAEWDQRYLQLARTLRKATGTLPLELVVPFWWGPKQALLRDLAASVDSLAVMDYRTQPDEIYRFAVPFLDWAETNGKRVRIALEAGPVAPETQRRYERAGAGELLLVRLEGRQVLVLLRRAARVKGAEAFKFVREQHFDGSATSFHKHEDKLRKLLPQLERDFSAWRGFGGIALHELR